MDLWGVNTPPGYQLVDLFVGLFVLGSFVVVLSQLVDQVELEVGILSELDVLRHRFVS